MTYKVNVPFAYFGNKDRFYKDIRSIFLKNKRDKVVDLFGGGCSIPLSLKNEFNDLDIYVNIKDKQIEKLLNYTGVVQLWERVVDILYSDDVPKLSTRYFLENGKKDIYLKMKNRYTELLGYDVCPHCGRRGKGRKDIEFTQEEIDIIKLFFSFGGSGNTLSSSFFSEEKREKLKKYLEMLAYVSITNNFFNECEEFTDSFIILDPPYIGNLTADKKQKAGQDYGVYNWWFDDDKRIVEFIRKNQNKNNVFLVFGTLNSNLINDLKNNFECEIIEKRYKKNTFGIIKDNAEVFCIIGGNVNNC